MARKPCQTSYQRELIEAMDEIVPPQWFARFPAHGNALWTPRKIFWGSMIRSWLPKAILQEQFETTRETLEAVFPRWALGRSLSGFLEARRSWADEMHACLKPWLQRQVALHFEDFRVQGWLVFGVDGSRFEACRTTPNEQGLGCAGQEATTPQVFQTTILHVGTGLVWDFRLGPGPDSERRHLDAMQAALPAHALLTADAGFLCFDLARWFLEHSQAFVIRVGGNVSLLTGLGWTLEIEGKTVYVWPQKQRHRPPIVLRLIVIRPPNRRAVHLVTNVLDETLLSDEAAAEIYRLRWGLEVYDRSFKQTFDHKTLRSRTPSTSLVEQAWHVFSLWALQLMTARQLIQAGRAPASWSAAKARRLVRQLLRQAASGKTSPPSSSFRQQLQKAGQDAYQRKSQKETRVWPRKKQQKPPGPPKIHPATAKQRQQAKQLRAATLTKL